MPKKEFTLLWSFDAFAEDPSFFTKRMFGGMAAYVHGRMVMVIFEDGGDRKWKGTTYPFDLWNGILFPTEREHHESLIKQFPSLISHPVLGKWLYQPQATLNFEEVVESVGRLIARDDFRFGIYPKPRKPRRKAVRQTSKGRRPPTKKMKSTRKAKRRKVKPKRLRKSR